MSRPSVVEQKYEPRRSGVIDFINSPLPPHVYPNQIACNYEEPYMHVQGQYPYPYVGAPYIQAPAFGMHPAVMPPPPPSIPVNSVYAPMVSNPYQALEPPAPSQAPSVSAKISGEELDSKINAQINNIMAAQKAEMLCGKIENLTNKVQRLSQTMELNQLKSSPVSHDISSEAASRSFKRISSHHADDNDHIASKLRALSEHSHGKDSRGRKYNY